MGMGFLSSIDRAQILPNEDADLVSAPRELVRASLPRPPNRGLYAPATGANAVSTGCAFEWLRWPRAWATAVPCPHVTPLRGDPCAPLVVVHLGCDARSRE
jgi:hypothetical protein